jgi:hypothetical protein
MLCVTKVYALPDVDVIILDFFIKNATLALIEVLPAKEKSILLSGLKDEDVTKSEPSIAVSVITVISLSAFLLFHSVGFNVIPFILMGELCPVKLKSLTSGKENKEKLARVARAVKQVMKFRPIWADFFEDGLRTEILLDCVSH